MSFLWENVVIQLLVLGLAIVLIYVVVLLVRKLKKR